MRRQGNGVEEVGEVGKVSKEETDILLLNVHSSS